MLKGKSTGMRLLGKRRHRWEDDILNDLKEIGICKKSLVDSAQDMNYWGALINAASNLQVP